MKTVINKIKDWPNVEDVVILNAVGDSFFMDKEKDVQGEKKVVENLQLLNFIAKSKMNTKCEWESIYWQFPLKNILLIKNSGVFFIIIFKEKPDIQNIRLKISKIINSDTTL